METRHGLARIYTGITFIFVGHFIGIYPIGSIVPPDFFLCRARHGKTQECTTGILSILPTGQNQKNLKTIAELCIR